MDLRQYGPAGLDSTREGHRTLEGCARACAEVSPFFSFGC